MTSIPLVGNPRNGGEGFPVETLEPRTQRRLQREMSRRKPESKRREKTRVQLAKSYAKTTRRRSDTTHKASRWLVDLAAVLRIETLKVIALSRG